MFEDEPSDKPASSIIPGEDLSSLSVAELRERVDALESELTRARAMIETKQAGKSAAEALFKG